MGWLIGLGICVLLALLPLGISARYGAQGPLVRVIAGPLRLTLYPRKKKEKKKPKTEQPKPEKKPAGENPAPEKKDGGGSWKDFLPLVNVALELLGDFRRKLRVNLLECRVILAGGDPADLAIHYGRAWAALGALWPRLERFLVIRKRDVEIECDFCGDETKITFRLDITITLGRLLALGVVYGVRAIKEFLKIKNKRKGGATL